MRLSKREELVQKAVKVFYRNGFHATGMDALAAETGVSKTSIYNHFRTKEDLILGTLRLRDEQFRNWLFRRIEELGATPLEQLLALFDALQEWFARPDFRGCMFIKAAAEYQDAEHPIHVQSAEHKRLLFNYVRSRTEAAGASDPDGLARQLLLLKEGAIVSAQLGHAPNSAAEAKLAAKALIAAAAMHAT